MLLDKINCKILNLLQENCRMSLTKISEKVGLSTDSTKKRIDKMLRKNIFYPKIQLRPRHFGYPYIAEVKIKLRNFDDKSIREFIEYNINHPKIPEVFSISGQWDFTIVIIAKDHADLGFITDEIRTKFNDIIGDWSESLTTFTHKFESYDMIKLLEYDKSK